jgi:acetoin utilization deacetylase AcuC-like enzyme
MRSAAVRAAAAAARAGARPDAAAAPRGLPVVHHELYSAPRLPHGHRFPMGVFQRIHDTLLAEGVVAPGQVVAPPAAPPPGALERVHDAGYLAAVRGGRLDADAARRIGFGAAANGTALVARTLAEVSGTVLLAELALQRGLAVATAGG